MLVIPTLLLLLLAYTFDSVHGQNSDHITCSDSGLDWYTSVVGETPCATYQKLRRLCDPTYQIGVLNANTSNPPDFCDDQIHDCCCNSASFSLSMLCLNCQQGVGNNGAGNGIDAPLGTYQKYLTQPGSTGFCSPNFNSSLPSNIQAAVCNNNIRIFDSIVNGVHWNDGPWFYKWSSDFLTEDSNAKGNNSFSLCDSSTSSSSTNTLSSSTASLPTLPSQVASSPPVQITIFLPSSGDKINITPIVGAAIGSAFLTGLIAIAVLLLLRRRQRQRNLVSQTEPLIVEPSFEGSGLAGSVYTSSVTSIPIGLIPPRKNAPPESRTDTNANGSRPPAYERVSER